MARATQQPQLVSVTQAAALNDWRIVVYFAPSTATEAEQQLDVGVLTVDLAPRDSLIVCRPLQEPPNPLALIGIAPAKPADSLVSLLNKMGRIAATTQESIRARIAAPSSARRLHDRPAPRAFASITVEQDSQHVGIETASATQTGHGSK